MATYMDGMDGGKHNSDNTETSTTTKKKQTAVEFLFEKIVDSKHDDDLYKFLAQAKVMEKEQHFQTFIAGGRSRDDFAKGLEFETFPDYYDNTYKTNE